MISVWVLGIVLKTRFNEFFEFVIRVRNKIGGIALVTFIEDLRIPRRYSIDDDRKAQKLGQQGCRRSVIRHCDVNKFFGLVIVGSNCEGQKKSLYFSQETSGFRGVFWEHLFEIILQTLFQELLVCGFQVTCHHLCVREYFRFIVVFRRAKVFGILPKNVYSIEEFTHFPIKYLLCFFTSAVRRPLVRFCLVEQYENSSATCDRRCPTAQGANPASIALASCFSRYRRTGRIEHAPRYDQGDGQKKTNEYPMNWLHTFAHSTARLQMGVCA